MTHRFSMSLLFLSLLLAQAEGLGCGTSTACRPETWSGSCHLETLTKVRENALPLPSVVYEAIYRPQSKPGEPLLPDVRREFVAVTRYEEALQAHVTSFPSVTCYVNPPTPGACHPGSIVVEVPDFDATHARENAEDSGPKGCAQIDAASTQDKIRNQGEAAPIPERFTFTDGSAELGADADTSAEAVAQRLRADPSIQCLGVVGQFVHGETLELAIERARAVRKRLIALGVEPERLVTFTLDRPTTHDVGAGTSGTESLAARRVTLNVLLKLAPQTPP